jgi:4-hydroxy-tetrahydrodipicolinate synthase
MKNLPAIQGSGAAIITPFDASGRIDDEALVKLMDHWTSGGLDVLVILGTTGESVTLSSAEKHKFVNRVVELNQGRCSLVLGMGGNNTAALCSELEMTDLSHFEAILSVTPYYNKPSQEGLFQHYKAVSGVSSKPVILYNVPGRTGINMTAETTIRIAKECPNVCAIKEASGNIEQIMKIIHERPEHFLVLSGDDALTLPILAAGGHGVISVIANAFPSQFTKMVHATMHGNLTEARQIHYDLLPFMSLLFREGNPAGIKALLKLMGLCEEEVRLPLSGVSSQLFGELEHALKTYRHVIPGFAG